MAGLTDLAIQFSVQGLDEVRKAIESTKSSLGSVTTAIQAVGAASGFPDARKAVEALKSSLNALEKASKAFWGALSLVGAGIQTVGSAAARVFPQIASFLGAVGEKAADVGKKVGNFAGWVAGSRSFDDLARAANLATGALGAVVGQVKLFALAGLAASVQGQILNQWLGQLSLAIGGLFKPEIEAVIDLIGDLVNWITNLSDEQAESIARWAEAAAAALAVAVVFPRVASAIGVVITAVRALTAAIVTGLSSTGIGALLPLIGLLLGGLTALVVGTETGRNALSALAEAFKPVSAALWDLGKAVYEALEPLFSVIGKLASKILDVLAWALNKLAQGIRALAWLVRQLGEAIGWLTGTSAASAPTPAEKEKPDRKPLPRRGGGFEAVEQTFRRIAMASIAGPGTRQRTNELLEQVRDNTGATNEAVRQIPPAVGR